MKVSFFYFELPAALAAMILIFLIADVPAAFALDGGELTAEQQKCYEAMEALGSQFELYCTKNTSPAANSNIADIAANNGWKIICPASQNNKLQYDMKYDGKKLEVKCSLHGIMSELRKKYISARSKKVAAETKAKAAADPLKTCYDNLNKIMAAVKKPDQKIYDEIKNLENSTRRYRESIENGGGVKNFKESGNKQPDKSSKDEFVEAMRSAIKTGKRVVNISGDYEKQMKESMKKLEAAKKSLRHDQKIIDERLAKCLDGSYAWPFVQPVACPEKGVYSVSQNDNLCYIIKCGVHGEMKEIYSKIYERDMKKVDPVKLCFNNIRTIESACQFYLLENEQTKECNVEMLCEKGYLQIEYYCPSGGKYTITHSGTGANLKCTCSVHSVEK